MHFEVRTLIFKETVVQRIIIVSLPAQVSANWLLLVWDGTEHLVSGMGKIILTAMSMINGSDGLRLITKV